MKENTKTALICLCIPIIYILLFILCSIAAGLLEHFFGVNGFYLFFMLSSTVLLSFFPVAAIVSSVKGIIASVRGIHCGENRALHSVLIFVFASCILFSLLYGASLLKGMT